jgi:hypothetical protein
MHIVLQYLNVSDNHVSLLLTCIPFKLAPFLVFELFYVFQIVSGCWMHFWNIRQLDIYHQYLRIINHNS